MLRTHPAGADRRRSWRCRQALGGGRVGRRPRHRRPPVAAGQAQPPAPGRLHPVARRLGDLILAALDRNAAVHVGGAAAQGRAAAVQPLRRRRDLRQPCRQRGLSRSPARRTGSAPISRPRCSSTAPEDYDGGELVVEDTYGAHRVKLPAGDMILYPGTSLHRVEPVTRGVRLAAFFWIQSMVRDDASARCCSISTPRSSSCRRRCPTSRRWRS